MLPPQDSSSEEVSRRHGGRASRVGARRAGTVGLVPESRPCPTVPATQPTGQGPHSRGRPPLILAYQTNLGCMDADDSEPDHGIGPSDYTSGPSGVADASKNTHLPPPVPHTP
ncbi:hypothetical protein MTO96_007868 [Rhipicephalus appendiculatus]